MQSSAQPALAATGANTSPHHLEPLLGRKQRLFAGMDADRDNQPVAEADGMPDHVEMAVGDGVEGAGIQRDAGHTPVYRAPGSPASRPVPGLGQNRSLFQPALNHLRGRRVSSASRPCFFPPWRDETKLRQDETIFRVGEDIRKPALDTQLSQQMTGRKGP